MIRWIKLLAFTVFFCGFFAGCRPKETPIWDELKMGDIPPANYDGKSGQQMVRTSNFNIYVYEIPRENFEKTSGLWEAFSKQDIYLLDYRAFSANSFQAGLGLVTSFEYISKVLEEAEGTLVNRLVLLIPAGQSHDVEVTYLDGRRDIFYTSVDGSLTGDSFGLGYLVMRLLAKNIAGMRGVSNVQFGIVFRPPITTLQALEIRRERREYLFIPTIFNVNMKAGDLVLLSPKQLDEDGSTLDGLFFGYSDERDVFRLYLILCTGVSF